MKLAQRVLFTLVIGVAYAASLIILVTAFTAVLPLLVCGFILTAAAVMSIDWFWADYKRNKK